MNTMLKASALVISIAALFALPSGKASASSRWFCDQQYEDCIRFGVDYWTCTVEYYTCRGMLIPVKAPAPAGTGMRKD